MKETLLAFLGSSMLGIIAGFWILAAKRMEEKKKQKRFEELKKSY